MLGEGGDCRSYVRIPADTWTVAAEEKARIACGEHASVQLRKVIKAKDLMGCEHVTHVFF